LYESLLNNIMTQLEKDDDKIKESTTRIRKDIIKLVTGAVKDVAMNYADAKTEEFTGMKISEALVKYGVTTREEQSQIICDFKDRYTSLIREFVEHSLKKSSAKDACDPRIVIFVDDLDRLNPARAVEMLEVLKLFMDVENCVYVLAIDYDVVVNGVRQKYGSTMSEDKCRSFFDKIIQLPFSMPVSAYRIGNLLTSIFQNAFESHKLEVENYIGQTLGMNPRTLKRLANSYYLLESVEKEAKGADQERTDLQHALLILTLATQMYSELAYEEIARCQTGEALKAKLGVNEEEDASQGEEDQENESAEYKALRRRADLALTHLGKAYESMEESLGKKNKGKQELDLAAIWIDEIHLSSITNVASAEKPATARNTGMIIAMVGEEQFDSTNATDIFRFIVSKTLYKNMDKMEEILKEQKSWISLNGDKRREGYFGSITQSDVIYNGQTIYLGTNNGNPQKRSLIQRLCKQLHVKLGDPKNEVKWIENDNNLLNY
ncbi:MAG: hypothetical protein IKS85_00525, partial [Lachnospiraceae bacterium]|nr:hypothetical protein [Lachnospiraceae bacterium]